MTVTELLPFLVVVSLAVIPACVWLLFFLHENWRHPEPRILVFYTFLGGMFVVVLTLLIQNVVQDLFFHSEEILQTLFSSSILSFKQVSFLVIFGAIEEISKFLVVWFLIKKRGGFREPLDVMIYMIVAALGFATVENILYGVVFLTGNVALSALLLRAIGATLLHALASGTLGYYWALGMFRRHPRYLIPKGLAFAIFLHAVFNYLIITAGGIVITPFLFLVVVFCFIFVDFENIKLREHRI